MHHDLQVMWVCRWGTCSASVLRRARYPCHSGKRILTALSDAFQLLPIIGVARWSRPWLTAGLPPLCIIGVVRMSLSWMAAGWPCSGTTPCPSGRWQACTLGIVSVRALASPCLCEWARLMRLRAGALIATLARRLLHIPVLRYVDDFFCVEATASVEVTMSIFARCACGMGMLMYMGPPVATGLCVA